jgi:RNA polymerase sigma-70 factor (ECF subfamily)
MARGYGMRNSAFPITSGAKVQQFEQLYQENLNPIYRYVYGHVRNREAAEDLTSQIFLKAVRSLDLKQSAHSGSAWLFRVAYTTMADYWRAHYRRVATQSLEALVEAGWEGPSDADPSLVTSGVAERAEAILQALPKRDREVLTCRFLLHLSVRETALSMGVTEANVKVMQYRALRRAATLVESAAQPKSSNASPHP